MAGDKIQRPSCRKGERRQVSVIFSPESATEINHKMLFKARLQHRGTVFIFHWQPVISAAHGAAATMRALDGYGYAAEGHRILRVSAELSLGAMKATPVCCTLAPKESRRLQLEFKPTQEQLHATLEEGGA
eukprot:Skav224439  [mRNA]  locus=scaffold3233:180231:182529:+ [translate_table: standard]